MASPRKAKKHEHVTTDMVQRIQSGTWRASERLPSQADLALEYGVSLGTLQKCIKQLEADGLLVSVHGSGTYVTTDSPPGEELVIWRFRDASGRLMPIYSRVEAIEPCTDPGPWCDHLGTDRVLVVRRRLSINLTLVAFNEVYLDRARHEALLSVPVHRLDGHDLTRTLDRNGQAARSFTYRIRLTQLGAELSALNQMEEGSPGLDWQLFGWTQKDRPCWYQSIHAPLGEYVLEIKADYPERS